MYRESDPKPTFRRMAADLGVHHEALRLWVRHAEHAHGPGAGLAEENKRLRKRIAELEGVIAVLRATRRSPYPTRSVQATEVREFLA